MADTNLLELFKLETETTSNSSSLAPADKTWDDSEEWIYMTIPPPCRFLSSRRIW